VGRREREREREERSGDRNTHTLRKCVSERQRTVTWVERTSWKQSAAHSCSDSVEVIGEVPLPLYLPTEQTATEPPSPDYTSEPSGWSAESWFWLWETAGVKPVPFFGPQFLHV
jgi:hypothetical protein